MAELVGLVSSIATLAAAGFHVARKISTIADDLGTAGSQIKSIAIDTKAVAIILRDIEAKLLSGKDSSRRLNEDTRDVLAEVVELCRHEIDDLNRNLAPLKDDDRRGDTAYLRQKAKWLFDKPKIAARQGSLDSLKLTLSLLLHNVQLFDGERLQETLMHNRVPLLQEPRANTTVVLVNPIDEVEPPPTYQVINEYHWQDQTKAHGSGFALKETEIETEMELAGLSLSETEASKSGTRKIQGQAATSPSDTLTEVQERVRCLAMNKQGRRDARRAERASKLEAWKERKQAKRAAWREKRCAIQA